MIYKINTVVVGLIIGAILPMVSFFAFYELRVKPTGIPYDTFLLMLHSEAPILFNPVVFIMLLVNGVVFGILINFKLYKMGFGIFYITAFYGILALFLKWYFFGILF